MLLQLEPFGGIAILWPAHGFAMLVDPLAHECWIVWHGRPIVCRAIPCC